MTNSDKAGSAPLVSVTYISHSLIEPAEVTAQCQNIERVASINNANAKVSGILIFCNNRFIQRLEGNKREIDALITKIKRDTRHRNLSVLYYGEIKSRVFKDWSHMTVVTEGQGLDELEQLLISLETRNSMAMSDKESRFIVNFIQHYH